jgi:hypothetical protein
MARLLLALLIGFLCSQIADAVSASNAAFVCNAIDQTISNASDVIYPGRFD